MASTGTPIAKLFYALSAFAAVAAAFVGYTTIFSAAGAPQEAAGAAFACLIAIVPYVLARSVDELTR